MITQIDLNATAWTAITSAGQSGSAWLDEDLDGQEGKGDVRVTHSDSGAPAVGTATEAKRIYKPSGNNDLMLLSADNGSDIFYAICIGQGATAKISVDVV